MDGNGLIQAVDMTIIADCGSNYNEGCAIAAASVAPKLGYSGRNLPRRILHPTLIVEHQVL